MSTATEDRPETETIAERPMHLAKCAECAVTVQFQPSASGTGFTLVSNPLGLTFGIGAEGRPICPNGHGEMAIADDQFQPAEEAFALAQERLDEAQQAALPGVFPPFNYEGAFGEIVEQARRVELLKADYDEKKQDASDAKKSLDKASELLMKMTLEFERRRKEKAAAPPDASEPEPGPRLIRCTWEAKHDGQACPICSHQVVALVVERILGVNVSPADAEAHVDDVDKLLVGMEVEEVSEALQTIDTYIDDAVIRDWSPEDRKAVTLWADYQDDLKHGVAHTENADLEAPARPKVLGRPHIPEDPTTLDGPQACAICGEKLPKAEGSYLYAVTDLVGTDCSGKSKEPEHRYPETGKTKKGRKS